MAMSVQEGDKVLIPQYGGSPVKVGEEEYHLFRDHEYVFMFFPFSEFPRGRKIVLATGSLANSHHQQTDSSQRSTSKTRPDALRFVDICHACISFEMKGHIANQLPPTVHHVPPNQHLHWISPSQYSGVGMCKCDPKRKKTVFPSQHKAEGAESVLPLCIYFSVVSTSETPQYIFHLRSLHFGPLTRQPPWAVISIEPAVHFLRSQCSLLVCLPY